MAWSAVNGWPILPKATSGPLFVDDAQELTESHLHRVFRFGAVAVATQKDLAVSFSKAGFQVRTERVKDRTDFFGLLQIVERRLEWARRGSGPLPRIEEGALRSLSLLHKHDLRAIQSDLYDLFQKLEACE